MVWISIKITLIVIKRSDVNHRIKGGFYYVAALSSGHFYVRVAREIAAVTTSLL